MKAEELKTIIKESVREAIKEERISLYEILVPTVSKKEMDDINTKLGSPKAYKTTDFVDMTDWVKE